MPDARLLAGRRGGVQFGVALIGVHSIVRPFLFAAGRNLAGSELTAVRTDLAGRAGLLLVRMVALEARLLRRTAGGAGTGHRLAGRLAGCGR